MLTYSADVCFQAKGDIVRGVRSFSFVLTGDTRYRVRIPTIARFYPPRRIMSAGELFNQTPGFSGGGINVGELDFFEISIKNVQICVGLLRAGEVVTKKMNSRGRQYDLSRYTVISILCQRHSPLWESSLEHRQTLTHCVPINHEVEADFTSHSVSFPSERPTAWRIVRYRNEALIFKGIDIVPLPPAAIGKPLRKQSPCRPVIQHDGEINVILPCQKITVFPYSAQETTALQPVNGPHFSQTGRDEIAKVFHVRAATGGRVETEAVGVEVEGARKRFFAAPIPYNAIVRLVQLCDTMLFRKTLNVSFRLCLQNQ